MSKPSTIRSEAQSDWLALVAEQVGQLRFGVVQITVHDSHVVQIERTEKVLLDKPAAGGLRGPTVSPEAKLTQPTGGPPPARRFLNQKTENS